jgi:hypothetical protein
MRYRPFGLTVISFADRKGRSNHKNRRRCEAGDKWQKTRILTILLTSTSRPLAHTYERIPCMRRYNDYIMDKTRLLSWNGSD